MPAHYGCNRSGLRLPVRFRLTGLGAAAATENIADDAAKKRCHNFVGQYLADRQQEHHRNEQDETECLQIIWPPTRIGLASTGIWRAGKTNARSDQQETMAICRQAADAGG